MKLTAVSGDMAIKLAIGAGAVLAVYLIAKKAKSGLDAVGNGLSDAVDTVLGAPGKVYHAAADAASNGLSSLSDWVDATGEAITQGRDDAWDYATAQVPDAIKPSSPDNLINRGLTSAGATLSGDKYWTLGGWIYDVTH